jgi:hypothetical protein
MKYIIIGGLMILLPTLAIIYWLFNTDFSK